MVVVRIGPFIGRVNVDEDSCAILNICHIWDRFKPIATVDLNTCLDDCSGPEVISDGVAKMALLNWLDAGRQDLLSDLTKSKGTPLENQEEPTEDEYNAIEFFRAEGDE